eukprot:TRINITY_DN14942_c0_g1_i1.p1 TRINITY_DN14942_c0_g1~~TRINITY_DN14942_c0_g1_i1.p1  ORF type:complete len:164 (+),score=62.34 TRINITY_DN14942_c0_g1_i1:86-577(+)
MAASPAPLQRYLASPHAKAWLALPPEAVRRGHPACAQLSAAVLAQLDAYVTEMEDFLVEEEDGVPRWTAAKALVTQQIDDHAAKDGTARPAVAQEYVADLEAERDEVEAQIAHRVAEIVREQLAAPATPEQLQSLLDGRLRAKVHRLVELPLWRRAAETAGAG